jgi:Arc/MetJ-type ribon-helix-helix transcriptional regulator
MNKESMIRTQIYLTRDQDQSLKSLAVTSGIHQSELVRQGIDLLLAEKNASNNQWKQALNDIYGIWEDDEEAEHRMHEIRAEFDRQL